MPSAFEHGPTLTVVTSPTANAGVIWSAANNLGQSTVLLGTGTLGISGDTDIITLTANTVTVAGAVTASGTVTANLIAGAALKDEDNMASNSATHIASQQSIKAYVDANAGGDFYDTITNGTTKVYVDNNASSGFTLNNNYKFQINMPTSGEGFFFKCADQGSEHSALFYADYPSQITKICGSSKWDVLNGGSTGSSGDGKFYVVCDANSRAIWIYNREGYNRTITVHGMGRIVSVTAQVSI